MFARSSAQRLCSLLACTAFFSGGCRESGSDSSSVASDKLLTVTGSLADWPGAIGSFSGYNVLLVDVDSQRAFRTELGENPGFVIERVPKNGRYVAVLLDSEFRFGWILQLARTDSDNNSEKFQVFRFANGNSLGSLSLEGKLMKSSEQTDLFPVDKFVFTDADEDGIPDGLQTSATTFQSKVNSSGDLDADGVIDKEDFDQDNDGVPNPFDNDADDDGISNTFDGDSNQDGKTDQEISWEENALVAVPKVGFKYMFHEVKKNSDGSETVSMWPVFSSDSKKISAVSIVSGSFLDGAVFSDGSAFTGDLFDDGTHGDGVSNDGVWSTPITLAAGERPTENQAISFRVSRGDSNVSEYVVGVGTLLSGDIDHAVAVDSNAGSVNVTWTASGQLADEESISFQVLVFDADGKRVYTSTKLAHGTASHSMALALFDDGMQYKVEVRALAPSPRDGFPGSAWRSDDQTFTP